jgi:hypothetical protein
VSGEDEMSILRTDEFAAHLGVATTPTRAQASLDVAEALVASYLSIDYNRRGNALQEHTISERITPVRDKTILEVSGGPITAIESIAYNVVGERHTNDELDGVQATFDYVFSPEYSGWAVGGRTATGEQFVFQRGEEYRVTYRTGWCAGNTAYEWEWFRDSYDTWDEATSRLSWGFSSGTATTTNAAGDYLFGPRPTTRVEGIHYETGGSVTAEQLVSPSISFSGSDYPFVVTRLQLIEASTTGYPLYQVSWLGGDNRDYYTDKKTSKSRENFLPDRIRAATAAAKGYNTLVADMGFNAASTMNHQTQDPQRSWIDSTISRIRLQLWDLGASDPNGALYLLDYVRICDGTARMPEAIKMAVLETARAVRDGSSSGIQSESIGDYSMTLGAGEAAKTIPPIARTILDSYRRPSW